MEQKSKSGQQISILWGPARSGKSALALSFYSETLKNRDFGKSLWLTPNQRSASELRAKLAEKLGHGCLQPGCFTFAQFAESLIAYDDRPMRPIDSLLKRQILQQVIHDSLSAGKLQYFAPIADSEGLLLWIDALISDLKRQEIWPDAFLAAAKRSGLRPKDTEVAEIYSAYQELLLRHHCYDAEGRFWAAREALAAGRWGAFAGVTSVVVDGFTDFTWTQHEILKHLASRAERMWISLQGEDGDERRDLFAKPRTTLEQIQKRIPHARVQELNRPTPPQWPAMMHLEQRVFGNPRRHVAAPEPHGIEIWACENQKGELRRIAREIKKLLVEGEVLAARGVSKGQTGSPLLTPRAANAITPERIGVVFRSVTPIASQVREIFQEYGLPFVIDEGTPLGESPLVVSLLQMLQLIADDWPYRRVLQTLASNYVTFDDPTHRPDQRGSVEWAVRELQISEGRNALFRALDRRIHYAKDRVKEAEAANSPDLAEAEEKLARWEQAHQILQTLAKACDVLPKQATWHDWRGLLQRFANKLGMLGVAAQATSGATGSASGIAESEETQSEDQTGQARKPNLRKETPDLIAWRQLLAGLNAAERWQQWRGVESAPITLADLIAELILIGSTQNMAPDNDGLGRVRVMSAPMARTGEFEVLFLAGLSEKSFPQLGGDDRLYSGAETHQLNQAGLRFAEAHERSSAEMLLFYEVLTRPTRRLVLSYPALDEKAEPLTPSPYVAEVRRAFGEPGIVVADDLQLSPIPPDHQTLWSEREQRIRAVAQAGAGDSTALARVLTPQRGKPTLLQAGLQGGLLSIAERATREEFGQFEGMVLGSAAQTALAKSFGPEHCWSTSQLEQYAACPFKFFANRVLKLDALPEPIFATDHAGRGSWYHGAVTWMFRAWAKNPAEWEAMQRDPVAFAERCAEALAAQKTEPALEHSLERAMHAIDTAALKNLLSSYLVQAASYAKSAPTGMQAQHFEVAFGPGKTSDRVDSLCKSEPWQLVVNDETFKLSGQIDRIDLGTVGTQLVFGIIDYKTGNQADFKEADFAGTRLQLPLYALAAEEHLLDKHGAVAWQMGYWSAKHKTVKPYPLAELGDAEVVATEDWKKNRELLRQRVWALVNGIRHGQYPMSNPEEQCTSMCEYSTICRVNQARSLEKTWEPVLYQIENAKRS